MSSMLVIAHMGARSLAPENTLAAARKALEVGADLWELDVRRSPPSCFTIGIDSIDAMITKLREAPNWPIYKIKLGTEHDVEIVRAEPDYVRRVHRSGHQLYCWVVDNLRDVDLCVQHCGSSRVDQMV